MMEFTAVYYSDLSGRQEVDMLDYVKNNKLKLISYEQVDVSDFSMSSDIVNEFKFERSDEAMLFRLRFPNRKGEADYGY